MTRGQFEQAFQGLPKRRREVLELFLVGVKDEEIAQTLHIKEGTVRSHIRNSCDAFGLENLHEDDYSSRRGDLIELFKRYKPELVKEKEEEARSQFNPNFVGREEAIADLNTLIENGAKCIQILSAGGQGKTTLAWQFFKTCFAEKDILYFPIGKETKDIASIESLVEERLRLLGEEPGREFMVSLGRLRERLTRQPMGVLIDNLEPALDESNRFVEQHRSYVELFKQALLFPEVRSEALKRLQNSKFWFISNQIAARFWTETVKIIETVEDTIKALEAYFHYLSINDFEKAGITISFERNNKWSKEEPLGRSLYRIGQLNKAISIINYIIAKIESYHCLSSLYNILGDLYWLVGNLKKSIVCHKKSEKIAIKLLSKKEDYQHKKICSIQTPLEVFIPISLYNIGLCKIDMWEIEKSFELFEECEKMLIEYPDFPQRYIETFKIDIDFCLAFLNSCIGFEEKANNLAEEVFSKIESINYDVWSKGYSLLFLASTYKNIKKIKKSFMLFNEAIKYSEKSAYIQVKAKALTGLAELYRIQSDFEQAINHHLESIQILDKIGAKCDLAEAYYQLALTYQAMNNPESQTHFNKALELWTEIDAPKQIERVRNSMNNPLN